MVEKNISNLKFKHILLTPSGMLCCASHQAYQKTAVLTLRAAIAFGFAPQKMSFGK